MAGFADIIRNGVALADSLTADLQPQVAHEAWVGNDGFGGNLYAGPIHRAAIVEVKQKLVRTFDGSEVLSSHVISLLRPVANNGATGRREPIDPRDRFTLPDGTTGPVIAATGFVDSDTGASYFHQVFLGESR